MVVEGARDFAVSGEAYDRFMGRYSARLAPLLADLCGVEAGDRLLDVGCGPGAFTAEAVRRLGASSVVAVDPSPGFVEACRRRFPGVEVLDGAAEELPVADGVFDRVVSQLVLHFVSDAPRALAEMRRAARPGGVVGGCTWSDAGGMELVDAVGRARRAVEPPEDPGRTLALSAPGELAGLFADAGLREVEEQDLTVTETYADVDDLWDGLLGGVGPAGAYVVSLDDEARERYRDALEDALGRPTGAFSLSATARAARGVSPGPVSAAASR